jgi:glycerol-3-phosphate acyltransferase PlsY
MPIGSILLSTLAAYLLGSVPFGILICKPLGKDPRNVGSGRTGGTNVYRTAGATAGLLTVLGDVVKGTLAVLLAGALVPASGDAVSLAIALAALGAILGHNYSIFAGFAGGAGSTPNIGALLGIYPQAFVPAAILAALVWKVGRMASVASLTLSTMIMLAMLWVVGQGIRSPWMLLYGFGQLVIVGWALKPNIQRLLEGREIRVDRPVENEAEESGPDAANKDEAI